MRRALRAVTPAADELGLKSIGAAQRLQVQVGSDGISASSAAPQASQIFTRRSPIEEGGENPIKSLEQLAVEPDRLVYRTWDYISWSNHRERIKVLMQPLLDVIGEVVSFEAIGLEYLDRFRRVDLPNEGQPSPLSDLLQVDSGLVASHIFSVPSLFHSHTGAFVATERSEQRLQVVRVDAVDELNDQTGDTVRWINVTTTQEDRFEYASGSREENPDPMGIWDETHSEMKTLLGRVITPEQSRRIYLQG